jgi:hypothetical protein
MDPVRADVEMFKVHLAEESNLPPSFCDLACDALDGIPMEKLCKHAWFRENDQDIRDIQEIIPDLKAAAWKALPEGTTGLLRKRGVLYRS